MSRNRPQGTKSPERLVLHRVLINSNRFYIHTNLIKFVIAHFKFENRSMSCTFQLICIASLLAFSTFILVFMQNCRDCLFSNSEMTPMLPLNTRYRKERITNLNHMMPKAQDLIEFRLQALFQHSSFANHRMVLSKFRLKISMLGFSWLNVSYVTECF